MRKVSNCFVVMRNLFYDLVWNHVRHFQRVALWTCDMNLSGPLNLESQFPSEYLPTIRYASRLEKSSNQYRRIMRKLLCFKGCGPIGPNKFWEYPWAITNSELFGAGKLSILDAGCGKAPVQYFFAENGHRVCGVDSREYVSWHGIDRSLADKYGLDIEYRVEGMENLSYGNNTFDRVFCLSVLEHCSVSHSSDPARPQTPEDRAYQSTIMKEFARVLRPGGILIVTVDFNLPTPTFPLEANVDCLNLIQSSGLEICGDMHLDLIYGSHSFNIHKVIDNPDVDVVYYQQVLQTSLGMKFRKPI